jgi:hypothetical protein
LNTVPLKLVRGNDDDDADALLQSLHYLEHVRGTAIHHQRLVFTIHTNPRQEIYIK